MHHTEILQIAAAAWDRTKPADDPSFNNCSLTHRENLVAQTETVIRTGGASNDFEKAVLSALNTNTAPSATVKKRRKRKQSTPAVVEAAAAKTATPKTSKKGRK